MENELTEYRENLERLVREGTAEIEEINIALKNLLKQNEEETKILKDNVTINLQKIIVPYLKKLKKSASNHLQAYCLEMLDSSLQDIFSPLINKMNSKSYNLTQVFPVVIN